jgi:hypothetical protein
MPITTTGCIATLRTISDSALKPSKPAHPINRREIVTEQGTGASADADQALVAGDGAELPRLHPTGFDPSRCENRCDDCGGVNPVWYAPNALWNLVVGGPEAKGDPGGFICPGCFIARAEASGIRPTAWELRPERHV